jgi:hypothetical protein
VGNSFFSGGAIFGFMPNGSDGGLSIDAGLFYRNTKTISPYLGVQFNKLNAGLSYDVNMDNKGLGLNSMRAWELGVRFGMGGNYAVVLFVSFVCDFPLLLFISIGPFSDY